MAVFTDNKYMHTLKPKPLFLKAKGGIGLGRSSRNFVHLHDVFISTIRATIKEKLEVLGKSLYCHEEGFLMTPFKKGWGELHKVF